MLYLLEDDEFISNALRLQLKPYGYKVRVFCRISQLQEALHDAADAAMYEAKAAVEIG